MTTSSIDIREAILAVALKETTIMPFFPPNTREFINTGNHLFSSFINAQNDPPPNLAHKEYNDYPYVPEVSEIDQVPRVIPMSFNNIELTEPQIAIVCSLAYGPRRDVSICMHTHRSVRNFRYDGSTDSDHRRLRLLFAPTGTGKTIMATLSTMLSMKRYYEHYRNTQNIWLNTPDLSLINIVIVSSPRCTMAHWLETLNACSHVMAGRGHNFEISPRKLEDIKVTKSYIKKALECTGLFIVIQSNEVSTVIKRIRNAGYIPYGIIDDEFASERINLRYREHPFMLGITATPMYLSNALYGMQWETYWRQELGYYTSWSDYRVTNNAIKDIVKVYSMNNSSHYYAWLVYSALERMPPGFHLARVRILDRSLAQVHVQRQDPTHQITLSNLCTWLQMCMYDENAPMPMLTLLNNFNAPETSVRAHACIKRLHKRVSDGQISCVVCYEDMQDTEAGLHNILITPCCTNLVCEKCYPRLRLCPCCREPLKGAETRIVDNELTGTKTEEPSMPLFKTLSECLQHIRNADPYPNAFVACSHLLDMLYAIGLRRVILAWRFESSTLTMETRVRKFIMLSPDTHRREGRAIVAKNIEDFNRGDATEEDRMYVLVINSALVSKHTEVAGVNLPLAQAIIFTGAAQDQIIGRVLRMGQMHQPDKLVIHFTTLAS